MFAERAVLWCVADGAATPSRMIVANALLFDMDGLMVDSEPLWFDVEREFARDRGGDWTEELAHECIGRGLANTLRVMHEVMRIDIDVAKDTQEVIDRFLARAGEVPLKPGCVELIGAAEGVVPIAVGSSSARRLVEGVLRAVGVASRFGVIITGDDVPKPKPAPDIFLEAARRLGVAAEGCVVLEDSLAGAMAGRAAGMAVIAVPEQETPGMSDVATRVVADLFEARKLLDFRR